MRVVDGQYRPRVPKPERAAVRAKYRKLVAAGICGQCSIRPATHGQACEFCVRVSRAINTCRYVTAKADGLCTECHQPSKATRCERCASLRGQRRSRRDRKSEWATTRARQRKRARQGLCPKCGDPAAAGFVQCARHVAYSRTKRAEHEERIKAAAYDDEHVAFLARPLR